MWYYKWYVIIFLWVPVFTFITSRLYYKLVYLEVKYNGKYAYHKVKSKYSFIDKIRINVFGFFFIVLVNFIPIFNMLLLLGSMFGYDRFKERTIEEMLKKGSLTLKEAQK